MNQKGFAKIILIGFIILLGGVFLTGVGVHKCYVYESGSQYRNDLCDKQYQYSSTDSYFDAREGVLKVKQMRFVGIYKEICVQGITMMGGGCTKYVFPWLKISNNWVVGSRNCELEKSGAVMTPSRDIDPNAEYEKHDNELIKITYVVLCDYINGIYGVRDGEYVDKQILIENGYTLPKDFKEKITINPKI